MGLNRKKPLRADPETTREWKKRSRRNNSLKRSRLSRGKGLNPRNDERAERERDRAYGPPDRRRMVKRMQCCVPGCHAQAENAHLPGAGGMGYKGDADTVVNLCGAHHRTDPRSLHNLGSVRRFKEQWGVFLPAVAKEVEKRWQEEAA